MPLRLLIVEPAPLLRAGLCAALETAGSFDTVVATSLSATSAPCDVVLLSASAAGGPAPAPVLVLCSSDPVCLRAQVGAGAAGVATWCDTAEDLVVGLHRVAAGQQPWLSPSVVRHLHRAACAGEAAGLTPREREVLSYLAAGLNQDALSDRLCIATGTLRNHLHAIYRKLGVENQVQAVVWAWRQGLVPGVPHAPPLRSVAAG